MSQQRGRKKESARRAGRSAAQHAVGPAIELQEPLIEHQEPPIIDHGGRPGCVQQGPDPRYWPASQPLPTAWPKVRRQRPPCPKCRRILLEDGGQAVVVTTSGHEVAFFRCKACGKRWQLPVKEV